MRRYSTLIQYARRQPVFLALVPVLTVAASLLAALQPWPMKLLADHVLDTKSPPATVKTLLAFFSAQPDPTSILTLAVLGGLFLFALNSLLDVALSWSWTLAGRRMVYQLAEDLFARIQRRSLAFHRRGTIGDQLGRVTGDSWVVYQVVDTLLFSPAYAFFNLCAMLLLMWQLDVAMTLLALVTAPLMVAASLLVGGRIRTAAKTKREAEVGLQSHIQQTLTGLPVVQAFAQEDREHARFQKFADAAVRAQQRTAFVSSINGLNAGLITTVGAGLILWVGSRAVIEGRITIGSLLVFLVYLNSLQTQMQVFAGIYTSLQGFSASADRVNEILRTPPEVAEKSNAPALPRVQGRVCFESVTFGYEPDRPVLRDVSLEAHPGEIIAIVGPTGAGKSTLISLIPRLFDPSSGRVLLDGHDVRDVKLKSVRDQVAMVLQEPFLFPLSVAENIAYGRPEATLADIEAAARAANAHEFILRLPEGYQSVLGERGATLSGGERQRLSIARALLRDAPVLILDEPTSALDVETEASVMKAVERLMQGRTTFVIAHRLSTVRRAHRIVVLEAGRVVETGTHDELLARGGLYARLSRLQSASGVKTAAETT